jgi:hypothetical protein
VNFAKALVYPPFNARYYSLYLEGLFRVFGRNRVRFTKRGFPRFGTDCMAIRLIVRGGHPERRVYIHSNDFPVLDEDGLAWCDVFGKVNLDWRRVPGDCKEKVLPLGPTFAIRTWNPLLSVTHGVANFVRSPRDAGSFRKHLANYRGQSASRFPESAYRPSTSDSGYVFYNAAIWEREPEANALRARFVEACRSMKGIRFEGGLSPRRSARGDRNFRATGYEPHLSRRFTPLEYLEKTRASAVVLNNPAYEGCHSWRLAESLALGKAIISTPIVRELPAPLVHGTHLHCVDGSVESFRSAIGTICGDADYRARLETRARAYYEEYLAPTAVVRRILHAVTDAGAKETSASLAC